MHIINLIMKPSNWQFQRKPCYTSEGAELLLQNCCFIKFYQRLGPRFKNLEFQSFAPLDLWRVYFQNCQLEAFICGPDDLQIIYFSSCLSISGIAKMLLESRMKKSLFLMSNFRIVSILLINATASYPGVISTDKDLLKRGEGCIPSFTGKSVLMLANWLSISKSEKWKNFFFYFLACLTL